MAKRKYTKRSPKKNNSFMIFLIIIIVLALLSFLISYFVTQTESEASGDKIKTEEVTNKETPPSNNEEVVDSILEGTWASYNDGAMLTVSGQNFSIELPSVESSIVASGSLKIVGKTVTFVYSNKDSSCGDKPGVYEFIFDSDEEITFKKINDNCTSRSNQMVASWFRV